MENQVDAFGSLIFGLVFPDVFVAQRLKRGHPLLFVGNPSPDNFIHRGIQVGMHPGPQRFIVGLVAILPLDHAALSHHLQLNLAVLFDLLMGKLNRLEHIGLTHLIHLPFDHHDVVVAGAHHDVDVGVLQLGVGGIDFQFAVDTGHADLRNGGLKGHIRHGNRRRGRQSGQRIGHILTSGRNQGDHHHRFGMEVGREKGPQGTVHQTGNQHLIVAGAAFTFQKPPRETARS